VSLDSSKSLQIRFIFIKYWYSFINNTADDIVFQGKLASWVPDLVFASLAFVTGLLALVLPETLNRPLPETIKEIESWTRSIPPASSAADAGQSPVDEAGNEGKDQESTKM